MSLDYWKELSAERAAGLENDDVEASVLHSLAAQRSAAAIDLYQARGQYDDALFLAQVELEKAVANAKRPSLTTPVSAAGISAAAAAAATAVGIESAGEANSASANQQGRASLLSITIAAQAQVRK